MVCSKFDIYPPWKLVGDGAPSTTPLNAGGSHQVFIYRTLWSCLDSHHPEQRNRQLAAFLADRDVQTVSSDRQPTYTHTYIQNFTSQQTNSP